MIKVTKESVGGGQFLIRQSDRGSGYQRLVARAYDPETADVLVKALMKSEEGGELQVPPLPKVEHIPEVQRSMKDELQKGTRVAVPKQKRKPRVAHENGALGRRRSAKQPRRVRG